MYAPHVATVYNVRREADRATFRDEVTVYITVLEKSFLDRSEVAKTGTAGKAPADTAVLYIPFGAKATDPLTGATKRYASPAEFQAAEDRSDLWTLSVDGDGCETFFALGRFIPADLCELMEREGCYRVTAAATRDYGSADMHHWEIKGA